MTDHDLVVLGAGASGLGAAREARRKGRSVALVDVDRPGGDCTHYGCVPSKALLETARRVQAARSGPAYGFRADVEVDFPRVMDRVHAVIADIERDESPELLARQGIELVRGWATFSGPGTLEVDGRVLTSRRFVVATGSRAAVPPVEGLTDVPYLDNKTVFGLRELPGHLLVLGGGPIGIELSQAFRRLGAEVTVVEGGPTILSREEPEARRALTGVLEREGVTLRTGVKVVRVTAGPVLHLEDGDRIEGTHLLVAVGRTPSTDGFGLSATGAEVDGAGRVVTDRHLQAAETVWAAGDCTSPLQFTHVGFEQGRIAAKNAFGRAGQPGSRLAWDDRVVPWVTFTEPEVAHVGLTEAQAYAQHGDRVLVSTVPDTASDRARTSGETDGFVKLLALPPRVGGSALAKLVGMTVVGPMAGEQIAEGALAMRSGMLAFRLAQVVKAYPTYALSTRVAAARLFREQDGQKARPPAPDRPRRPLVGRSAESEVSGTTRWRVAPSTSRSPSRAPSAGPVVRQHRAVEQARVAGVADAEVVAALLQAFNEEYATPTPGVAVLSRRLGDLLAGPQTVALLVGEPATGVALLTLRPNVWYEGPVGLLDELYVAPELRDQGLGTALLQAAERVVRERGGEVLEINVDGHDVDARRFYERHGYRNSEPGEDEPLLYYVRELG